MKEAKPLRPAWAARRALPSEGAAQPSVRAQAAMQTDTTPRKAGGRLSREDQRRLGDILQRVYDEVVKQGVPDRFRNLLQELDEGEERSQTSSAVPSSGARAAQTEDRNAHDEDAVPDRAVGARGLANPGRNGSH
jgi:Anti-sigma factor NepR